MEGLRSSKTHRRLAESLRASKGGEYMNKNLVIALVVALLVVGGVVMVQNNSNDQAGSNTSDIQERPGDSSSVMERESADDAIAREENTVVLTSDGFSPKTLTVSVGEEVVWVNNSGGSATVDSSVHPTHRDHPELNLGTFEDGEEHKLVFDKPGTYNYHDHLNASRFGTVVVE
jgi:plastocyanin